MNILRVLLLCLAAWAPQAWSHAVLLSTQPASGAVLDQAPTQLTLHFSEPVGVTVLRLIGPSGAAEELHPSSNRDATLRIPAPPGAAPGGYLLSWRVVSADGHPIGGALDYRVGPATGAAQPASALAGRPDDAAATPRAVLIWLSRWLGYLCLFSVLGAALFRSLDASDRQAWALPVLGLGVALLPPALALQGLDLLDAPWSGLTHWHAWRQALASPYAITLGGMALALFCATVALCSRQAFRIRAAGGLALLLAGAALAASGHAGTAPPRWLSRPAMALHVITAIAWIGLLIPLMRALARATPASDVAAPARHSPQFPAMKLFSRWITPVVALLALSGLYLIWAQFERPSDLWLTAYGRVLAVKLGLVGLLLCLAAWNRWRLTAPVQAGSLPARRRLRRVIQAEICLAILILAVLSLWRFTPPPRSLDQKTAAAAAAAMPAIMLHSPRVMASIQPGAGDWVIRLTRPDGQDFTAQGVTLSLSNPDEGIEPLRREARPGPGHSWLATIPVLPQGGRWRIGLDILVDDFEQISLSD